MGTDMGVEESLWALVSSSTKWDSDRVVGRTVCGRVLGQDSAVINAAERS